MKRAGLDYWDLLDVHVHENFEEVQRMLAGHHFYYNTTKAVRAYSDVSFTAGMCWSSARKQRACRRICFSPMRRTASAFP